MTPPEKKQLNRDRIKFGVGSLLYSGDESAFSPLHTAVIRALGGGDVHLGIMGAIVQSIAQLTGWIGAVLLHLFKFNRKAMVVALLSGAFAQALIVATLLFSIWNPALAGFCLILYITLIAIMAALTGAQANIVSSWIGDLVPTHQRGWFVGGMAMVSNIGLVILQLVFARLARDVEMPGYAALMGLLLLNTLIATGLVSTITNRPSLAVNFISNRTGERINYFFKPMWTLLWFECSWRSGRVALNAFTTAYLIDHFGYRMDRIILLQMIVNLVNVLMLFIVGKLSDRIGIFKPLALISAICGASMLLWVSTAWWGVLPIIFYQVINGAAGSTHWMLLNNLSLLIFPPKGRPNFLAFSRIVVGIFLMLLSTAAGYVMAGIRGWQIELWGAEFNHYHIFFLGCTILTLGCLIPLGLLKHMRAPDQPATVPPTRTSEN